MAALAVSCLLCCCHLPVAIQVQCHPVALFSRPYSLKSKELPRPTLSPVPEESLPLPSPLWVMGNSLFSGLDG